MQFKNYRQILSEFAASYATSQHMFGLYERCSKDAHQASLLEPRYKCRVYLILTRSPATLDEILYTRLPFTQILFHETHYTLSE